MGQSPADRAAELKTMPLTVDQKFKYSWIGLGIFFPVLMLPFYYFLRDFWSAAGFSALGAMIIVGGLLTLEESWGWIQRWFH